MKTYIELNDNGTLRKAKGITTAKEIKQNGLFGQKKDAQQ